MIKKILLIENDGDISEIIAYVLEDEGFLVIQLDSPQELDVIARDKPDLIMIDEWVFDEPGHRLCLRIKQYDKLSHLPVIVLSTSVNIEKIMDECRADAFIQKPFDLNDMLRTIWDQLNKSKIGVGDTTL